MMPFFLTMPMSRMMPTIAITLRSKWKAMSSNSAPMPADGRVEKDGDRVDHAFVEHAEDEIDDEERRGDQERRARQRRLEGLGVALEARGQRKRLAELVLDLLDGADRLPDRDARREIERDRHRRELALMVDDERRHA